MNSSTDGAEGSTTLPAFEFNPYTTEFDKNPYPAHEHLRKNAPVYWWPATNAWVITRCDDIAAAYARPDQQDFSQILAPLAEGYELAIGSLFRKYPDMQLEAEPTFVGNPVINRKISCLPVLLRP